LQSFFKTGKGQYGEGDIFIGVTTPQIRKIAKQYLWLTFTEIKSLLQSRIHECRLLGLLILIGQYQKGDEKVKGKIFNFYLKHALRANSWDLVDLSAPQIVGDFLLGKNKKILYRLAALDNLWPRRIAVVATLAFIRHNQLNDTFKITGILMNDKEELIHKACGWMLREAGKRNKSRLKHFLKEYCRVMPRTMLRYAIERLTNKEKLSYMVRPKNYGKNG
jgi:3-methyladenine DNA glycosylase AlkD